MNKVWYAIAGMMCAVWSVAPGAARAGELTSFPYFTDIYVLGDSLSDQGNLFNATEILTGLGLPAADQYYMGRFSNGEVYVDFLAETLGLTLLPSFGDGNNFAYGGARANYNRVEEYDPMYMPIDLGGVLPRGAYPWSLNLQSMDFDARNVYDPNALYIVWSGSNDTADLIDLAIQGMVTGKDLVTPWLSQSVAAMKSAIDAYLAAGARTIVVPKIPDLGLVPGISGLGPFVAAVATGLAETHNQAVDSMLMGYPGVNFMRLDVFQLLRDVVQNPSDYGLSVVNVPCYSGYVLPAGPTDTVCPNPDEYLFWDQEHPTTLLHSVLADELLADLSDSPLPLLVSVDVKPGSCPNPLNTKSNGVISAAIVGDGKIDLDKIQVDTVLLEGVASLRYNFEDVSGPVVPYDGKKASLDCAESGPDGYPDLVLKFDSQEIVAALGSVTDGETAVLHITGQLSNGQGLAGEDMVDIRRKGK